MYVLRDRVRECETAPSEQVNKSKLRTINPYYRR